MVNVSHKIQAVENSQFLVLVINYGVKCPELFCCILVNLVRKYKRRTEREKFTAADLQDAARKVNEDKRSNRSVAKEAGLDLSCDTEQIHKETSRWYSIIDTKLQHRIQTSI